ncbi:unnamed protein product [Anisakis simplex]|uniref:Ovule protein n=1 Tax=Anisakis simplex TaxID=6269 RepID=A0A0M3JFS9_ANISI|nr:unnamed protein product [Anisakis simplex]
MVNLHHLNWMKAVTVVMQVVERQRWNVHSIRLINVPSSLLPLLKLHPLVNMALSDHQFLIG